ncbi:hypothetical protein RHK62_04055 [Thermosynechococcus sp. HY213]|uniref:hypothetical protein n=1 Tax=unclassified Thermosynechococcus TaxID=2622553 RepID=UPI00285DCE9A|nr:MULTISPECIES: hypothetical protein [unclassified Thermosynechococcus]MDR5639831.1 hypothetical protein [Thermosynechococcus sp. PP42]MDR7921361.1 hypothetical protein [Thermosynechococcus sp. HY213]MDR7994242.1 hypothetical protein [Thermosynechococcus sp. TG252]
MRNFAFSALLVLTGTLAHTVTALALPTATLQGRIFFGDQMGNVAPAACSAIQVVAKPQNLPPIKVFATGPAAGAQDGQCTFKMTNVPAGVPIELSAVYSDLLSYPEKTYPSPAGKWQNPFVLRPAQVHVRYIELDGKP